MKWLKVDTIPMPQKRRSVLSSVPTAPFRELRAWAVVQRRIETLRFFRFNFLPESELRVILA